MVEENNRARTALARAEQRDGYIQPLNHRTEFPSQTGAEVRRFFQVLRYHRWMVAGVVLVTLALVGFLSQVLPKKYEGVARLVIDRESPAAFATETLPADQGSFQDYLRTQVRILESEALASQTLQSLGLGRNPAFAGSLAAGEDNREGKNPGRDRTRESELRERFLDNLFVTVVPNSWVVEVRFYSRDTELAARVANVHAENFIEHNFRTKFEATQKVSHWLSEQLLELRSQAESAGRKLADFERRYGHVTLDEFGNVQTQRLEQLNEQLAEVGAERAAREGTFRQAMAVENPALLPDEVLETLLERRTALRAERAQLVATFLPTAPRVRRLDEMIAVVEKEVAGQRETVLRRLRDSYEAAVEQEKLVRTLINRQQAEVNDLNQRLVEYNILQQEAVASKQLYENVLQQMKEATISSGLRSSNIRLVDPARPPVKPYSPDLAFNLVMAFLVSFPLAVGAAFLQEALSPRVRTREECERVSSLPTLVQVPWNGAEPARPFFLFRSASQGNGGGPVELLSHNDPRSPLAESFRMLRTWVSMQEPEGRPRTLLVTSSQPGEGKTATAVNLAVSMAQRNEKVVLVGADLRNPSLQEVLQLDGATGLSHYLLGEQPEEGLAASTPVPNLYCIPAGPPPDNPAELLAGKPMKELLGWLRQHYSLIVLDTPPVLVYADAVVLSEQADGVLLVARSGQTSPDSLRRSRELLDRAQAPVLGVVLNGVEERSFDYYY